MKLLGKEMRRKKNLEGEQREGTPVEERNNVRKRRNERW